MYVEARRSFVALCDGFSDDQWAAPVPCNPEWRVWDVLSHVAGVTDDIVQGRVDGAATDPWTAAQVERWRTTPRRDLIDRWGEQIEAAASAIDLIGEGRPPLDCHSHEHDVRHALGLPGNRDSALVRWMVDRFVDGEIGRRVDVVFDGGGTATIEGPGEAIGLAGVSPFELVRARLGRRSRDQVLGWGWSERPSDALLDAFFVFGPSPHAIVE